MSVIDAHAHLDERMLDVATMLAAMDRRGIDKVVLIPCMNDPLPQTPTALLWTVRQLLRSPLHRAAKVINDLTLTSSGDLRLGRQIIRIYSRPDNATVASILAAHPSRFLGWIFLNPHLADQLDELERWRAVPGMVGVKLHPHWHGWPVAAALPIARRCQELGLPILIHLGFDERGDWRGLADACPRLKLVFAHAGIPHFDRLWPHLRDRRLFVDVSSPYLDERLVRAAAAVATPDRLLFGTDAPYGFHAEDGSYDFGVIKGWVERLPVAAPLVDRVLGDNILQLLDRASP